MSELDAASLVAEKGEYLDPGYDGQTPDGDNLLLDFCRADVGLWRSWGAAIGARSGGDERNGTACNPWGTHPAWCGCPEVGVPRWPAPDGLEVRRVDSAAELADFERTLVEAYPVPDLTPWRPGAFMGEALLNDPR